MDNAASNSQRVYPTLHAFTTDCGSSFLDCELEERLRTCIRYAGPAFAWNFAISDTATAGQLANKAGLKF